MTANQRRSGFRLPWSSEQEDAGSAAPEPAEPSSGPAAGPTPDAEPAAPRPEAPEPTPPASPEAPASGAGGAVPHPPDDEPSPDFMRELVEAMRRVAVETRTSSAAAARSAADERVKELEAEAERRRAELRERADADIAAVGEWARAEAERIRLEAEARVTARRAELEQQLSTETARSEADAKSVRDRIAEYERELEAFTAQLNEIADPAAFAAAAKRIPRPPAFASPAAAEPSPGAGPEPPEASATSATNGAKPEGAAIHPAEEEVLAARLAELDAALPATEPGAGSEGAGVTTTPVAGTRGASPEPMTTEIVVKGLGSFGAITSFRQALAGVEGVDGVALRLGETGEFIFRTTHAAGFDLAAAIVALEGDGARVERRGEHDLLVTLQRGR